MTTVDITPEPVRDPVPAFCRGLAVVVAGDAVIVDGAASHHRFTGRAATTLLPRILPLLDGSRTVGELAARLELPAASIRRMVELLRDSSLLDGPRVAGQDDAAVSAEVSDYYSRTIGAMDGQDDSGEVLATLARSVVYVELPEAVARSVVADLLGAGVGTVFEAAAEQAAGQDAEQRDAALTAAAHRLVVLYDATGDGGEAEPDDGGAEFARACVYWTSLGVPVLRCAERAGVIELGPCFLAGQTACERCFRSGRRSLPPDAPAPAGGLWPLEATREVLASLVASETLAVLTRSARLVTMRQLARVPVPGFAPKLFDVVPDADCAQCGPGRAGLDPRAEIFETYEWLTERPASELAPSAHTSPQWRRGLLALEGRRKSVPYAPRRGLGDEPVGELFARVAGLRDPGERSRWAPSGGNLGSVELYAMAEGPQFEDLGTIVRYDDIAHALTGVHTRAVSFDEMLKLTTLPEGDWDMVVCFVAGWGRLLAKYRAFAYRLSLLDAGCAATQLTLLAEDRGLRTMFARAWEPELDELLDLDPEHEAVTAVVGVEAKGSLKSWH